jgi:hypothetical protein
VELPARKEKDSLIWVGVEEFREKEGISFALAKMRLKMVQVVDCLAKTITQ